MWDGNTNQDFYRRNIASGVLSLSLDRAKKIGAADSSKLKTDTTQSFIQPNPFEDDERSMISVSDSWERRKVFMRGCIALSSKVM